MQFTVRAAMDAMTADGSADGYVTVADNSPYYPGATVTVWTPSAPPAVPTDSREAVVTDLVGMTKIGVRFTTDANGNILKCNSTGFPSYGRSDLSVYLVASSAKIYQPTQEVPGDYAFVKR